MNKIKIFANKNENTVTQGAMKLNCIKPRSKTGYSLVRKELLEGVCRVDLVVRGCGEVFGRLERAREDVRAQVGAPLVHAQLLLRRPVDRHLHVDGARTPLSQFRLQPLAQPGQRGRPAHQTNAFGELLCTN